MFEARTIVIKKKPRIILDQRFKEFRQFQVGDKGQCIISGSIISDRKEESEDGTEFLTKTIEINEIEIIDDKAVRAYSGSI